MVNKVKHIIKNYHSDPTRLMDILIDVQIELGYISPASIIIISSKLNLSRVDVEQTISFYHFFHREPKGRYTIYLNDSAVSVMKGRKEIAHIFEEEVGCKFNSIT